MSFISDCCGATPYLGSTDYGRCSDCKENCEFIDEDLYQVEFDMYEHLERTKCNLKE